MRALTKTLLAVCSIYVGACGPAPAPGGGAGGTGGAPTAGPPKCFAPNRTVVVGDSYINWVSHSLPADLARESGQTWPNYAVGGASIASGGITGLIPNQLEQAISIHRTFDTLVFDGGGNDVLICDPIRYPGCDQCKNSPNAPNLPQCQKIVDDALAAAAKMAARGAQVGVRDSIYFYYPEIPEGTIIGGASPNEINAYARAKAKALCDSSEALAGVRCHFVDMAPVFAGHPEYFAPADIHPNGLGSAAMAKAIWAKMKEKCVSQPASAGCGCQP